MRRRIKAFDARRTYGNCGCGGGGGGNNSNRRRRARIKRRGETRG